MHPIIILSIIYYYTKTQWIYVLVAVSTVSESEIPPILTPLAISEPQTARASALRTLECKLHLSNMILSLVIYAILSLFPKFL